MVEMEDKISGLGNGSKKEKNGIRYGFAKTDK